MIFVGFSLSPAVAVGLTLAGRMHPHYYSVLSNDVPL